MMRMLQSGMELGSIVSFYNDVRNVREAYVLYGDPSLTIEQAERYAFVRPDDTGQFQHESAILIFLTMDHMESHSVWEVTVGETISAVGSGKIAVSGSRKNAQSLQLWKKGFAYLFALVFIRAMVWSKSGVNNSRSA